MRQPWDRHIAAVVEEVTETLATELDPEEKHWPDVNSLAPLRADLDEALQAAIADWLIEKRDAFVAEQEEAKQQEQALDDAAHDLEDAAYEHARDEAMQATGVDEEHEAMMADRPEGLPF